LARYRLFPAGFYIKLNTEALTHQLEESNRERKEKQKKAQPSFKTVGVPNINNGIKMRVNITNAGGSASDLSIESDDYSIAINPVSYFPKNTGGELIITTESSFKYPIEFTIKYHDDFDILHAKTMQLNKRSLLIEIRSMEIDEIHFDKCN